MEHCQREDIKEIRSKYEKLLEATTRIEGKVGSIIQRNSVASGD